jgi:hypothetical protein
VLLFDERAFSFFWEVVLHCWLHVHLHPDHDVAEQQEVWEEFELLPGLEMEQQIVDVEVADEENMSRGPSQILMFSMYYKCGVAVW